MRLNRKAIDARIVAATNAIVVGKTYFKSDFYDKRGAFVTVLDKSTERNAAGWPSSVKYRVIETFVPGEINRNHTLEVGYEGVCNASNLYTTREDASHTKARF